MNRKARRSLKKIIKQIFSNKQSTSIMGTKVYMQDESIPEGTKVKININTVNKGNSVRNKWVDENKEKVFTVAYREDKTNLNPTLVELEEDRTWLWYVKELIVCETINE